VPSSSQRKQPSAEYRNNIEKSATLEKFVMFLKTTVHNVTVLRQQACIENNVLRTDSRDLPGPINKIDFSIASLTHLQFFHGVQ
jgi:hypothetical protein